VRKLKICGQWVTRVGKQIAPIKMPSATTVVTTGRIQKICARATSASIVMMMVIVVISGSSSAFVVPKQHTGRLQRLKSSNSAEAQTSTLTEIPFVTKTLPSDRSRDLMVGEDAGIFDIGNEEWGAMGERGCLPFQRLTILTFVAVL
jgi:hypothetical protein